MSKLSLDSEAPAILWDKSEVMVGLASSPQPPPVVQAEVEEQRVQEVRADNVQMEAASEEEDQVQHHPEVEEEPLIMGSGDDLAKTKSYVPETVEGNLSSSSSDTSDDEEVEQKQENLVEAQDDVQYEALEEVPPTEPTRASIVQEDSSPLLNFGAPPAVEEPKFEAVTVSETSSDTSSDNEEAPEASKTDEPEDLLGGIESFDKSTLKNVEVKEETPLPTAEAIDQERILDEQEMFKNKGIFDQVKSELVQDHQLHHTETKEASLLPDKYDILKEKATHELLEDVESFEAANLRPTSPRESDPLQTMIRQDSLIKNIEGFDKDSLKHSEIQDTSAVLPTKEDIETERAMIEEETEANKEVFQKSVIDQVESFDPAGLKHVETDDKSNNESILREAYVQEKTHNLVRQLSKPC